MTAEDMSSGRAPTIRQRQFSLRWLMGLVGVTGCYLGLARYAGWPATAAATTCLILTLLLRRPSKSTRMVSLLLCLASIQLAWISCPSVWYTDGEVMEGVAYGGLFLISVAFLVLLVIASARTAAIMSTVLLVPFIARQCVLILRLQCLQSDVAELADVVEKHRIMTGAYPASLPKYDYNPVTPYQRIAYWPGVEEDSYVIGYKLYEGDNTCREYSPHGGWYYYPD